MKSQKFIAFFLLACIYGSASSLPAQEEHYTYIAPTRDGIGKVYMGREIARVIDGPGAIIWLERTSRSEEEEPDKIVTALNLKPGDSVADIGAGSGYLTFRISRKVPKGKVFAVDISKDMVQYLQDRKARENTANVFPVLGTATDTALKKNSIDVALMVDAYHEFSHPREMMVSIVKALKKGGRVVLVEYRAEDTSLPIKPLHKMSVSQAKKEMAAVGLNWLETLNILPIQHIIIFQKP